MRTTVPSVRTLVLILVLSVSTLRSFSQSIITGNGKFEIGAGIGPMFFLGDLGGNYGKGTTFIKDVNLPLTKMAFGAYVSYHPTEWLGFRLAINKGKLEGYDSLIVDKGGDEYFRKNRNLQFQSNLLEGYLAAEIYPSVFLEQYDGLQGKFRPYGVIGIGAFHFNPQGKYYDPSGRSSWVDLQPLHLEGQGFDEYPDRPNYSLTQIEIPMGGGFKYYIKENMYVGMEVLFRKTFTDYIDDVSKDYIDPILFDKYLTPAQAVMAKQLFNRQGFIPGNTQTRQNIVGEQRGNPKNNDNFFSTILRFGWRLNQDDPGLHQMRCPSFY